MSRYDEQIYINMKFKEYSKLFKEYEYLAIVKYGKF